MYYTLQNTVSGEYARYHGDKGLKVFKKLKIAHMFRDALNRAECIPVWCVRREQ